MGSEKFVINIVKSVKNRFLCVNILLKKCLIFIFLLNSFIKNTRLLLFYHVIFNHTKSDLKLEVELAARSIKLYQILIKN